MPLTLAEAARRTPHFTEPALRGLIRRGQLSPIRVAGRLFVTEDEMRSKLGVLFK